MSWKKILLIAAGTVSVLLLVLVIALFTVNLGVAKPQIERWVTNFTGRQLSIDGSLDIFLGGESVVVAEGVRFQNAEWAEEPDMFSVGRVELRLDTWSILDGPIRILALVVEDPALFLDLREDDSANWQLALRDAGDGAEESDDAESSSTVGFLVRRVDLSNAHIQYTSPTRNGPLDLRIAQFSQGLDDQGFLDLALDASLGGREVSLEATAGTWDDLLARRDIDFELSATIDTLELAVGGHLDDLVTPSRPQLDLRVRGPELNDLARLLRAKQEFEGDVDIALSLAPGNDGAMALELSGNLGRLEAQALGSFSDLQHLEQARLDLAVSGPDFGRLLALLGGPRLPSAPYRIEVEAERRGPELIVRQAHMEYADAVFDLSAEIPAFPSLDDGDIRLAIRGERYERFREITGLPGAAAGPYSLSFELADAEDGVEVISLGLQSSLGSMNGSGKLGQAPDYLGSDFSLELETANLGAVAKAYNLPDLPARPVAIKGRLELVKGGIRLDGPVNITSGEISANVDGLVSFSPALVGSQFELSADLPDLAAVGREFVGTEAMPAQPLHLEGRLEITGEGYKVPELHVDLGRSGFELDAEISRQPALVGSTVSLIAEGPAIEELTETLGQPNLKPGPFTLSLNLDRTSDGLRLDDLEVTRPSGRLGGDLVIGLPFDEREVVFDLRGGGDDLGSFAAAIGSFQPAARPFSFDARGSNRNRLLTLDRFDVRFGAADLNARGTVDLEELTGNTRLTLGVTIPDLAELGTYDGRAFNSQGFTFAADVNVDRQTRVLAIENLQAKVGESDLRGVVTLQDGELPELTVRVASDSLHISPLLEAAELVYDPAPEYDDGRLIPDQPIDLDALNRLNATVDVDIDEFQRGLFDVRSLQLDAELRDGAFELSHFGFLAPSGWLQATGSLGTIDGVARAEFALGGRDLTMAFATMNQDLSARARFDVKLAAAGNDVRSMAASINGAVFGRVDNLTIVESAILKRLYGDLLNEIVSAINPLAKTSSEQKLNCVVAPLKIRNGRVSTAPDLLIRTDKLRMVSEASINLGTEKIELQVTTTPRNGITISAGELLNPYVKVVGTLAKPRLAFDQEGVLISGGAAVATGGLSLLAQAAWRRLNRDGDPCKTLQDVGLEALGSDAFVEFPDPVTDP